MPVLYGQKINAKLYSAVVKRGGARLLRRRRGGRRSAASCALLNRSQPLLLVKVAYERSLLDFEKYVEKCREYLKWTPAP